MKLEIELPKFGYWYCERCGHQEESDLPRHSTPCYCSKCGNEHEDVSKCARAHRGRPRGAYPTVTWDSEPRNYNLLNSSDKEIQVCFSFPEHPTLKRRGVTCGLEKDELEDLGYEQGPEYVSEVLEYVCSKVDKYLYHGSKKELHELRDWFTSYPKRNEWKKQALVRSIEDAARKLCDASNRLSSLQDQLEELSQAEKENEDKTTRAPGEHSAQS